MRKTFEDHVKTYGVLKIKRKILLQEEQTLEKPDQINVNSICEDFMQIK